MSTHAPDIAMALVLIAKGAELPKEWGCIHPQLLSIHTCKDREFGITDLIGGKAD